MQSTTQINKLIGKFILRLSLGAAPIIILLGIPLWNSMHETCYGDINAVGTAFFDSGYQDVFSYQPDVKRPVTVTDDIESFGQERLDSTILIVGDSYSQQGNRSFMQYLQNEMNDWTVCNVRTLHDSSDWHYVHRSCTEGGDSTLLEFPLMTEYVLYLLQNARCLPKVIVVESGACLFVDRLSRTRLELNDGSFAEFKNNPDLMVANTQKNKDMAKQSRTFSQGLTYAQSWTKRLLGISNRQHSLELQKPLFSCKGKEQVLYFHSMNLAVPSEQQFRDGMAVKDYLLTKAAERGVTLLFMPCPDKLDAYRNQVKNQEAVATIPSLYDRIEEARCEKGIVNAKRSVTELINNGEKDVYFCNDTHWSYKAAEAVAVTLSNEIIKARQ